MIKRNNMNKKGQMSIFMIFLIFGLLAFTIMILVGGVIVVRINNDLNQDIDMGQVNLADLNADTFGVFATTYLNHADWWGICIIFGMILGLFLASYFMRDTLPKWGIILDIFIIIGMFILSLYISSSYSTLLDALSSAGENFLEVYTPRTSTFMVNLPIFIVIIGVISMVLFHSSIPRKKEERYQRGGYLQGI